MATLPADTRSLVACETMEPVASLIETLTASPGLSAEGAGALLLEALTGQGVEVDEFRANPQVLMGAQYRVSRYLTQVVWRALAGGYESADEVVESLYGMLDRNPPTLEPAGPRDDRLVLPEARIVRVVAPTRSEPDGADWESRFEAQVTSGPLRGKEVVVRARSSLNPSACFIVGYLWIHARIAAYNLMPDEAGGYQTGPDSFVVLEPLRQVNATAIARSLHCPKPQIDQVRRGRGEVTIHTLKGTLVHSMLDRMIQGEDDLDACYESVLHGLLGQLAAIAGDGFDDDAFRTDVLRHARALKEFIDANPHMRRDPQVELRRYSATIGIQGRIDAVFKSGNRLDIVELKTGKRIRSEDHAQLFIYRLLLSDSVRRARARKENPIELTARLLSSHDGTSTPLRTEVGFLEVLNTRNRLVAYANDLTRVEPGVRLPFAGYDAGVCGACPSWTQSRCREDSAAFGDLPESPEPADLGYFRKFSRLVHREAARAERDLGDLLDDSRLGFRVQNFRTIADVHCVGTHSGEFTFEFEENLSDLSAGDRVLVHAGAISSTASYHGYLRSVDGRRARVSIPLGNITQATFGKGSWTIDRFPSDPTSAASQTALFDFLRAPMNPAKRVVLGELEAGGDVTVPVEVPQFGSGLNPSQVEAVGKAIACPAFHLIWGPPGTGKTRVIPEIIRNVAGSVLLGAFTHTALDKMLLAVLDADPETRFIRMGRSQSSPELAGRLGERRWECFSEDLAASVKSPTEMRRQLDRVSLFAATAHNASSHPYLRGRTFEMSLVDEAGQLTEPLTLGLVMRARRFVLIGDDRQLPPVVRSQELEPSLFERLKNAAIAGTTEAVTFLDVQYRMHPAIMGVSNRLYYDGALSAGVTAEERMPPTGQPLTFVPVESAVSGRANPAEARAIAELVRSLSVHTAPEGIGVISPFRAQVVLLRQLLEGTPVTVDTVERFQGGEREVIVISFVRAHGSRFVFDDRRFNVAMTRARRKLILVAHPDLFRNTKYEWMTGFAEVPGSPMP